MRYGRLSARCVAIGYLLTHNKVYIDRIISMSGPGVLPDRIGYFKARDGFPVGSLVAGRIGKG